jgi:hypothetical protein
MDLLSLKHWHWVLIGLLVGLALGGAQTFWGPAYRDSTARTLSQDLFEAALLGRSEEYSKLALSDLLVHPPDNQGHQWVTGRFVEDRFVVHPPTHYLHMEGTFKYPAALPYQPKRSLSNISGGPSVREFLDTVARQRSGFDYRYAWYEQKNAVLASWTAGCVIIIGGIWPLALSLLTGERIGSGVGSIKIPWHLPPASKAEPLKATAASDPATVEKLETLIDDMQDQVTSAAQDVADKPAAATVVRQLSGDQEPTVSAEAAPADKDYSGEFYPTEAHAPKQPQAH